MVPLFLNLYSIYNCNNFIETEGVLKESRYTFENLTRKWLNNFGCK